MKILLVLFFSFVTPVVLFLGTILYGGINRVTIKNALAESSVYSQIATHFANEDAQFSANKDPFSYYVSKRFTSEYFKSKTESTLDDSLDWIENKTQTVPVVSFKELKEDMQKDRPELVRTIEHIPTEAEMTASGLTADQQLKMIEQAQQFSNFAEQDFTIPLDRYLQGLKTIYIGLTIAVPLLSFLLLGCLLMIAALAIGTSAKFKWLGIAFFLSSLFGYVVILSDTLIQTAFTKINILEQTDIIALSTPIILIILHHFFTIYTKYQNIASTILLIASAVSFLGVLLAKHYESPTPKPLKVNASFWTKPSPSPVKSKNLK
jgi:hypothetical protein